MTDLENFEVWARDRLGQGYGLEMDEGSYADKVTRWAFKAWRAGVAHEREECAKVCETLIADHCAGTQLGGMADACWPEDDSCDFIAAWNDAAAAIRARS